MTYPLSSAVTAGQPTLAAHYNNLRLDALCLGQAASDAATLGDVLKLFEHNLYPELLDTDRIRIPGSSAAPASVMVNGYLLHNTANADLSTAAKPSGAAATWYLFANRTAGSTSFTLTVNSSAVAGTDQRCIGRFYWDGTKIVPETIRTESSFNLASSIDHHVLLTCNGRLTLTTATPVTTADVTGGTVYFTPFKGNRIALYTGGVWRTYVLTELSLAVSAAANKNLDFFIYDNAGALTLEHVEWSNDTTRATALTLQDGVYVQNGATHKRYLGTVRTVGTNSVSDSIATRFVWNYYNRIPRFSYFTVNANHTYASTTRAFNNSTANLLPLLAGVAEDAFSVWFSANVTVGTTATVALGWDTHSVSRDSFGWAISSITTYNHYLAAGGAYILGLGYHYIGINESSSGTSTFQYVEVTTVHPA